MTPPVLAFALNRMAAPRLPFDRFCALAQRLGIQAIEIRNDLSGVELDDGADPVQVGRVARENGLRIRSINALQRFDQFDAARAEEAGQLAAYAKACGCEALVLCPTNSRADDRSPETRHADLVKALRGLRPILESHGLIGLVEPLGFEECAVRRKSQAVRAIEEVAAGPTFQLVHDTFHHHLAGEGLFFPARTGLIHISGVEDKAVGVDAMRDGHRVLVGDLDRLGNAPQIRRLLDEGYTGLLSFEPFAESIAVASEAEIEAQLRTSMDHLRAAVAAAK